MVWHFSTDRTFVSIWVTLFETLQFKTVLWLFRVFTHFTIIADTCLEDLKLEPPTSYLKININLFGDTILDPLFAYFCFFQLSSKTESNIKHLRLSIPSLGLPVVHSQNMPKHLFQFGWRDSRLVSSKLLCDYFTSWQNSE